MIALYMVIGAFALIGLAVTTWVAVRLPFWIRDIRREDREAETARVAAAVDPYARLNESEQRLRQTLTIPANTLEVGDRIEIEASGTFKRPDPTRSVPNG